MQKGTSEDIANLEHSFPLSLMMSANQGGLGQRGAIKITLVLEEKTSLGKGEAAGAVERNIEVPTAKGSEGCTEYSLHTQQVCF